MHIMHLDQVYPHTSLLLLLYPHNLFLSTSWSLFLNLLSPLSGGCMGMGMGLATGAQKLLLGSNP